MSLHLKEREDFVDANPDLDFLAFGELPSELSWNKFIIDLSFKLRRYGSLSEKQIEAARNAVRRCQEVNTKRSEEIAQREHDADTAIDVPEGRIEITGEVLSVREPEDFAQFPVWKMLVHDDRNFKVWGSVPLGLLVEELEGGLIHTLSYSSVKGARVSFVATVERSERDSKFGFYKRPSKARRLKNEVPIRSEVSSDAIGTTVGEAEIG